MKQKIMKRLISFVKSSVWYTQIIFGDCSKFWYHRTYNLDIVNLGSGSAKYGFDYSDFDVKSANWAMAPQTLVGDYVVLSNYLSFLKSEGAVVLITICPFSCLDDGKTFLPDKMYTIADMLSIPDFAIERKMAIQDVQNNPMKYFPLSRLIPELKRAIIKPKQRQMNAEQLMLNAEVFIGAWKKQFTIYSFSDEFSLVNKDRFEMSVKALESLVNLCIEHNFKPVIVLPPVSRYLNSYFDEDFVNRYIKDYVNSISIKDIPFLNYLGDPDFVDDNLYMNSNFLNSAGAKLFTRRIMCDLMELRIMV